MLEDIWDFLFSNYVPFITWTVIVAAIGGVAGVISAAAKDILHGDDVDPGGISAPPVPTLPTAGQILLLAFLLLCGAYFVMRRRAHA